MSTTNTTVPSKRNFTVDALRGFCIVAIALLHSIEHFNFYQHPVAEQSWLAFADAAVWDSLFFLFGGKAYGIFALLFGLTFFIQDQNALAKGRDFRWRFLWRMFLLLLLAQLNAAFFTAEVLVLFACVSFVLPLFARASNKTIIIVASILLLQPLEWGRMIYALCTPEYVVGPSLDAPLWKFCRMAQSQGSLFELIRVNLWEGQLVSLAWAMENARFFQTPAFFLLGMLLGRGKLLQHSRKNNIFWFRLLLISLLLFFPLDGIAALLPEHIDNIAVLRPLALICSSLSKASFMAFLIASFVILYHNWAPAPRHLEWLIPMGRMSLSCYMTQSFVGSYLFYHWGLYLQLGAFYSLLVGIGIVIAQCCMAKIWLKNFTQGPFETLWRAGTNIGIKS
ncbi:MAG: DUF418 domain-containing protein [Akkermansia sp.]